MAPTALKKTRCRSLSKAKRPVVALRATEWQKNQLAVGGRDVGMVLCGKAG